MKPEKRDMKPFIPLIVGFIVSLNLFIGSMRNGDPSLKFIGAYVLLGGIFLSILWVYLSSKRPDALAALSGARAPMHSRGASPLNTYHLMKIMHSVGASPLKGYQ